MVLTTLIQEFHIPFGRIVRFAAIPLVAAIAPILILPVISRFLGPEEWAALAVGQSVGQIASGVVLFGWGTIGPTKVAMLPPDRRWISMVSSLRTRIPIFVVCVIVAPLVSLHLVATNSAFIAGLTAIAFCSLGLSPAWYYVGVGSSAGVLLFDTVPRLLSYILAAVLLALTRIDWVYPAAILMGSAVGGIASFCVGRLRYPASKGDGVSSVRERADIPKHALLTTSALVASLYTVGSTAVSSLALSGSAALGLFAAITRLGTMAQSPATTLGTALQGWAVEGENSSSRKQSAMLIMMGEGILVGILVAIGLPYAVNVLFLGTFHVSWLSALFCGVAVACHAMSLGLALLVLIPDGQERAVSWATIVASLVGAPCLLVLPRLFGVDGAVGAVAIAQAVVVIIELPVAFILVKRHETITQA